MNSGDRIDDDYKKAFNLGYELAKELDLKSPMFKNQNTNNFPTNAVQAGMIQFVDEAVLSINKNIEKSVNQRKINLSQKGRGKSKKSGKGLIP